MESVVWPDGLRFIGEKAFARTGLQSVTLPHAVEDIGPKAFAECADLATAVLPEGLKAALGIQFKDCPKLKEILRY